MPKVSQSANPAYRYKIVLIITGSIAAYKTLDLIRLGLKEGIEIMPVMTKAAAEFVTPLSVASIAKSRVYNHLFSLKDETEMGHIRLSRESDLMVVAPATADIIAKLALGQADDLASTLLLASDKPVIMVPAMNVQMWEHVAVQRNVKQLQKDGVTFIGPEAGDLACGEQGYGRMSEPATILTALLKILQKL